MRRLGGLFAGFLIAALTWIGTAAPAVAGPFSNWAVVVVAGDYRDHNGDPSEIFDNARRDVAAGLAAKGFSAANILQYSVRPDRYPDTRPGPSTYDAVSAGLTGLTARATGGCLFYISSHGAPQGAIFGSGLLSPGLLAGMLNSACGQRPTIVIVSACFSGVFLQALSAPNRMVLTAARPDRTSFGCGAQNTYPYFDACFLQVLPQAHDFLGLASAVQACVTVRETAEGLNPPSEPQVAIDPTFRPMLPLYRFSP